MIGLLKNKSQSYKEKYFLARDGVQYPRIFPIHSRINPFYSRNFTFITQKLQTPYSRNLRVPTYYRVISLLSFCITQPSLLSVYSEYD